MRRMPEVIFDNCVLSNFYLSDTLDIIKRPYASSAYITDFVAAENLDSTLPRSGARNSSPDPKSLRDCGELPTPINYRPL